MTRRRAGFTLLEAVVALAIVSVVCVGVLASEATALRAEATAAERLPLVVLAQERIAALDLHAGPFDVIPDSLARGSFAAPFEAARWDVRIAPVPGTRTLFEVTVTVTGEHNAATLVTRRHRAPVMAEPSP